MKHQLRSAVCTEGRRMAGARALWVATGMKREQFGKPIIAIPCSALAAWPRASVQFPESHLPPRHY